VLKDGVVVVEEGEFARPPKAASLSCGFVRQRIEDYLRPLFQKVYTMSSTIIPWRWNGSGRCHGVSRSRGAFRPPVVVEAFRPRHMVTLT
jgi:hypothetical protein